MGVKEPSRTPFGRSRNNHFTMISERGLGAQDLNGCGDCTLLESMGEIWSVPVYHFGIP